MMYISGLADELLFQSGSYNVTNKAKEVLAKVAKVIQSKPDLMFYINNKGQYQIVNFYKKYETNWTESSAVRINDFNTM